MTDDSDFAIYEVQRTMDTAECYIQGAGSDADGSVWLVCERQECATTHIGPLGHQIRNHWTEELPYNCIPEFAVIRRAKHLAIHGSVAIPHVDDTEEI